MARRRPHKLQRLDERAFARVSGRRAPFLDATMPGVSTAANHSLLWLAVAAGLGALDGRRGRRAGLRGVLAIGGDVGDNERRARSALLPRHRPPLEAFPFVGLRRRPVSSSMPSGHAASAAAFATAAAIEAPILAVPLGALAAAVAYSRVYNGVHYPGRRGARRRDRRRGRGRDRQGLAPRRLLARHRRGRFRPQLARVVGEPSADGAGLTIVVNPAARSGRGDDPTDDARAPRSRRRRSSSSTTRPSSKTRCSRPRRTRARAPSASSAATGRSTPRSASRSSTTARWSSCPAER